MKRLLYYAIAVAAFLPACSRTANYPIYTVAPQPMVYYVAPGGAHVPLAQPIERMP